jgi:nitrilase
MLVDPWGQILAQQPQGAGLVLGDVGGAQLHDVRHRLPALAHRVL